MPVGPEDVEEEQRAFANVIATFNKYATYSVRSMSFVSAIPKDDSLMKP